MITRWYCELLTQFPIGLAQELNGAHLKGRKQQNFPLGGFPKSKESGVVLTKLRPFINKTSSLDSRVFRSQQSTDYYTLVRRTKNVSPTMYPYP